MKAEIKIKEVITTYKFVDLPYYSKSNCHFYKVYDVEKCICVTNLGSHESIAIHHSEMGLNPDLTESNEKEFKEAFDKITKILESKI
jgi:hypothetical protein